MKTTATFSLERDLVNKFYDLCNELRIDRNRAVESFLTQFIEKQKLPGSKPEGEQK